MQSFNKITLIGHLGSDPQLRQTKEGKPVCSFNVATSDRRGGKESTTWFRVTVWGQAAEHAANYLTKGRAVYVEGRVSAEEWTDREGRARFTLNLQASDVRYLDARHDESLSSRIALQGEEERTREVPF